MADEMLKKLRETFAVEAEEVLARLEDSLLSLADGRIEADTVNALFRAAHTLKGSALVVELTQLGELAHVVEELFSRWRDGKVKIFQRRLASCSPRPPF